MTRNPSNPAAQLAQQPKVTVPLLSADVAAQRRAMEALIDSQMQEGLHYGIVPGTKTKTLLQPGAELIASLFNLTPRYTVQQTDLPNGHREYLVTCGLVHRPTQSEVGQGVGMASSMESKYRYRNPERTCPKCGAAAIIKGKEEYGGGWLCFRKKQGCGAKFQQDDPDIIVQSMEKIENPDIADCYQTVLSIAQKRAFVKANRTLGAVSDRFTQDYGDPDAPAPARPSLKANVRPPQQKAPVAPGPNPQTSQPAQINNEQAAQVQCISEAQLRRLWATMNSVGLDKEELRGYLAAGYNLQSTKDISVADYDTIIDWIEGHALGQGDLQDGPTGYGEPDHV